ncbi:LexA repressor 2 [Desulfosarcina alkanivorans]|jgi:repressor LexA|uniref:LexA repressor 2 n=1 Tax=Desulfosarcina alkanivorans TaxID=571177 RepID=A0A5K7YF45_9BACT|nr:transcriptional repressor LexA [Desulfosarcina alkanivorans]BBO66369.1 LexA repressor 2 [Desulfosarcina alkanivorans]
MGRSKTEKITPLQRETLEEMCRYIDAKGYPPTVKELSVILGISHSSVHERINQLVRKGYLKREGRKARGLTVVKRPKDMAADLVAVAVVRTVSANEPVLAKENIIGEVLVDAATVKSGEFFALRALDDSMTDAGINDGDLIIVRRQQLAEDGDIVVAVLNGETTVKRLKMEAKRIALVPENRRLAPVTIRPEDDLRILGKVVGRKNK